TIAPPLVPGQKYPRRRRRVAPRKYRMDLPGGVSMNVRRARLWIAVCVLALAPLVGPPAAMQQAVKRPIEIEDVIAWKALGTPVLSSSGEWFGYRLAPQEGDAEVVLRRVHSDKELRFPAGEQPQGDGGGRGGPAGGG